jgi:invasion protein IalB
MIAIGNEAWTASAEEEPVLIAAMKSAGSLGVSATSAGGNEAEYEFSLRGFSAALNSIDTCTHKLLSEARWTDRPAA